MAFMQTQSSGGNDNGSSFLPILKYDARAGRLFKLDRHDNGNGWETTQTDITMEQPPIAFDFPSLEVGWCFFAIGLAPMWNVVPYGKGQMPPQPASPGKDDKGKPLNFKRGFRMKVAGKAIGGVRELGGNANALVAGLNELHTTYEAAPEAQQGKIPVAKMVNTIPVKSGQSTNYQPVFQIIQWVDRPESLGGKAPPPSAAPHAQPSPPPHHAAPPPNGNHVPPPGASAPHDFGTGANGANSTGYTPSSYTPSGNTSMDDPLPFAPEWR